ncbi:MAG: hypothetical protein ACP5PC_04830 [bacterium]
MIKGKEGIALVMAIFFIVAIAILLSAVLMLNSQEIKATQLQLDGNKAFYYAEAGVEYGLAQVLNGAINLLPGQSADLSSNFKTSLKQSSGDSNIDDNTNTNINLIVYSPSTSDYKFTCEVKYNKTRRKVMKEVLLYTGIWSKAMASNGDINLDINAGQNGSITINGDIFSNGNITGSKKDGVTINGTIYAHGKISGFDASVPQYPNSPSLQFPSINLNYYKSIAQYVYSREDQFINAFKSGQLSGPGVVYVSDNLHIVNLQGLNITGLTIVVEGDIHINNQNEMTIDGGSSMVTFVAGGSVRFNNDAKFTFSNCIVYAINNIDFRNMKANVTINNGAIYAQNGYISLNNIKNAFQVYRGNWSPEDLFLFDVYKTISWSDSGV